MINLLRLNQVPILDQLRLEEALLRASSENWCLINTNAPDAIVMGISGKPEKLLNLKKAIRDQIPLIKRFSGGGTVYIDPETVFVTFICDSSLLSIPAQPKPILEWSENFYRPLFKDFSLRENDYVFGEKKFGGNAQYIQKKRWLLHTSFLWDYNPEKMDYLLLPEKRPQYRKDRQHKDFLCTLKSLYPSKDALVEKLSELINKTFRAKTSLFEQVCHILNKPHRKATELITNHSCLEVFLPHN